MTAIRILGSISLLAALAACGGGGGVSPAPAPVPIPTNVTTPVAAQAGPVTSVTLDGRTVDFTKPISVKNGELIRVDFPSGGNTSVSATLNGAPASNVLNIQAISGVLWSARLGTTPGAITTLVVSQTTGPTNTLTFNVESTYQGTWTGTYSGGDSGTCPALAVSKLGVLSGQCTSAALGNALTTVGGAISANGQASFVAGTASTGATFAGTFSATTASGTWTNTSASLSGGWSASKQ